VRPLDTAAQRGYSSGGRSAVIFTSVKIFGNPRWRVADPREQRRETVVPVRGTPALVSSLAGFTHVQVSCRLPGDCRAHFRVLRSGKNPWRCARRRSTASPDGPGLRWLGRLSVESRVPDGSGDAHRGRPVHRPLREHSGVPGTRLAYAVHRRWHMRLWMHRGRRVSGSHAMQQGGLVRAAQHR
jgi:hypothetical protein